MSEPTEEKTYPVKHSAAFASSTLVTMGLIDLLAHLGPTGLVVSGLASYVAWKHGPELYEYVREKFPPSLAPVSPSDELSEQTEPAEQKPPKRGRSLLDRALGRFPDAAEEEDQAQPKEAERDSMPDLDAFFQDAQNAGKDAPPVSRLMPNDIVRNTPLNSYKICIGRSLTKKGNPPIWINFYGQHFKFIGASQYGKSSMAAAFLYLISRTHGEHQVLIALLDKEHKTSKLFADIPQLAEYTRKDGQRIPLHAKNHAQVLEYLGYVVEVMEDRYNNMTEIEVEQQPLLLVYLEEFLSLKNYYKKQVDAAPKEKKDQARKDYADLIFFINEIALRGLKVKVQLLLCAQVDYRDDDFQEALVSVSSGMSFCVRVTAAQAAGFYNVDLLKRNVMDDQRGQAVVETPDCKDLVLAPEYDLKKKLLAFEKARIARGQAVPTEPRVSRLSTVNSHQSIYTKPFPGNAETPISRPGNDSVNDSTSGVKPLPQHPHFHFLNHEDAEHETPDPPSVNVNGEVRDIIKRLHEQGVKHGMIAKAVKLDGRKYEVYKQVCRELGIALEKEA